MNIVKQQRQNAQGLIRQHGEWDPKDRPPLLILAAKVKASVEKGKKVKLSEDDTRLFNIAGTSVSAFEFLYAPPEKEKKVPDQEAVIAVARDENEQRKS